MKKVIFFDLDDTLINSRYAEYNAISEFRRNNKFDNITDGDFCKTWKEITERLYNQYLRGDFSFEEQRIRRIIETFSFYGRKISIEDAKEKFEEYLKIYEKNWILFDDTIDVLEKLKLKYKLAVISNGDGKQQMDKIVQTGIKKYFQEIIISSEIGSAKPNKKIFEVSCERMNALPEECIMIGDKFHVDIEGAINAGLMGIWIDRKNEDLEYKYKIKKLSEISKFLNI